MAFLENDSSGPGLWEREPSEEGGGYDQWPMRDGGANGGRIGKWAHGGGTQLPLTVLWALISDGHLFID